MRIETLNANVIIVKLPRIGLTRDPYVLSYDVSLSSRKLMCAGVLW